MQKKTLLKKKRQIKKSLAAIYARLRTAYHAGLSEIELESDTLTDSQKTHLVEKDGYAIEETEDVIFIMFGAEEEDATKY